MLKQAWTKGNRKRRWNLTWLFTVIVFFILILSFMLMGILAYVLHQFGMIPFDGHFKGLAPFIVLVAISIAIGTVLSLIVGRVSLRPIRQIIAAINELAMGRFGVRLHLNGPGEFVALSESFNKMAEELGGTEMLRTDFINSFSHEFKTPITSLRGFARILKSGSLTEAERNEYLDIIIDESNRLSMLASNVLLLSKVEAQYIVSDAARFDLSEQLRRVMLQLAPKWEKRGIQMDVQLEEVSLLGSSDLLQQLWINLLDNAIKFSREGGTIKVTLTHEPGGVGIAIADDGIGMSQDTAVHMFDKFYQGDPSRSTEGNGLGLTIARKIVMLHDGEIHADSAPGKGTTVTVRLPDPAHLARSV